MKGLRERVLYVATELIADGEFSLAKLRKHCGGISTRTIYRYVRYFEQKLGQSSKRPNAEAVFAAFTAHSTWRALVSMLDEEAEKWGQYPLALLMALAKRIVDYFIENPYLLVFALYKTSQDDPCKKNFSSRTIILVENAKKNGEVDQNVSPELVSFFFWGAIGEAICPRTDVSVNSYNAREILTALGRMMSFVLQPVR